MEKCKNKKYLFTNKMSYRKVRTMSGKGLSPLQMGTPLTEVTRTHEIDKNILPYLATNPSDVVQVDSEYYEIVYPTGQNYQSTTQNFHVNGSSDSLISLSESFFVINQTAAPQPVAPPSVYALDYSLVPFFPHFYVQNVVTKLNNLDVSDIHNAGIMSFQAFMKAALQNPRQGQTGMSAIPSVLTFCLGNDSGTASNEQYWGYTEPISQEEDSSTELFEFIPNSSAYPDNPNITNSQTANTTLANLNTQGDTFSSTQLWCKQWSSGNLYPNMRYQDVNADDVYEVKYRPKDAVWQCESLLPTNLQLDITLNLASNVMSYFMGAGGKNGTKE